MIAAAWRLCLRLAVVVAVAASAAGIVACSSRGSAEEIELTEEMDRSVSTTSSEVSIFYPSADVIAEERVVVDEGESLPLSAMRELFKAAPRDPDLKVTLPKATVRSVRIDDGVAVVDFGRDVLVSGEAEETQRTVLAAIIYTLKQFDGVEKVGFTVEGKTSGKLGGKDVAAFWGYVNLKDAPWSLTSKRSSEEGTSNQ